MRWLARCGAGPSWPRHPPETPASAGAGARRVGGIRLVPPHRRHCRQASRRLHLAAHGAARLAAPAIGHLGGQAVRRHRPRPGRHRQELPRSADRPVRAAAPPPSYPERAPPTAPPPTAPPPTATHPTARAVHRVNDRPAPSHARGCTHALCAQRAPRASLAPEGARARKARTPCAAHYLPLSETSMHPTTTTHPFTPPALPPLADSRT